MVFSESIFSKTAKRVTPSMERCGAKVAGGDPGYEPYFFRAFMPVTRAYLLLRVYTHTHTHTRISVYAHFYFFPPLVSFSFFRAEPIVLKPEHIARRCAGKAEPAWPAVIEGRERRVGKKHANNIFGGRAAGLSEPPLRGGGGGSGNGGDDLGKHFIAFDTMVKNAQGSDSKKCNW